MYTGGDKESNYDRRSYYNRNSSIRYFLRIL